MRWEKNRNDVATSASHIKEPYIKEKKTQMCNTCEKKEKKRKEKNIFYYFMLLNYNN